MPVTPLHIVFIWPFLRILRKDRIFLITGAMIPDLEIPLMNLAGFEIPRGIAHSIIGALTVDGFAAILTGMIIYRSKYLKKVLEINDYVSGSWLRIWLISSIGALTHISIDFLHHSYNPILWPILMEYYIGPLVYLMNYELATFSVHVFSIISLLSILIYSSSRMRTSFWKLISSYKNLYRALAEPNF
ncbi:MAG: DUF4184 family protein [Aigarchaeota archaeon]|nr:DUF4184 family protein [Aigarchaeota archaeon]MCX8192982.1 DUF4184 family protein [Nitrososphaeria archaeon]MDW7986282.1 DUF4184 family protein [Nitrososphaerota archaeon]